MQLMTADKGESKIMENENNYSFSYLGLGVHGGAVG
jgi:hypothetical protein